MQTSCRELHAYVYVYNMWESFVRDKYMYVIDGLDLIGKGTAFLADIRLL